MGSLEIPDWSPYASDMARKWLETTPDALHRTRRGTLISADLSGFTALSESMQELGRIGAERLTDTVNDCFDSLIGITRRAGGDVLKFGGDAILAWFEGEGSPHFAARAMVEMQRAMHRRSITRAGLTLSIGGHFGTFEFFLVGASDWRELVLAGSSATKTVEMESAALAGEIRVTTDLAERLPPSTWMPAGDDALIVSAENEAPRPSPARKVGGSDVLVAKGLREELHTADALGGDHRIATVVFLEMVGTDRQLADMGAEKFALHLNGAVIASQALSQRCGVQLLYTDVVADGIKLLVTAGAPTTGRDDAHAAVRFAHASVSDTAVFSLKAGANRGRVFAGFLGSKQRRTYTVMGDSVNLAARLMQHATDGQLLAGSELFDMLDGRVAGDPIAPFRAKGKSNLVRAVAVRRVEVQSGEIRPGLTGLVGRPAEAARIRAVIDAAAGGAGGTMEIVGPPGIGKSRLVLEAVSDPRVHARLTVECQVYDMSTPYATATVLVRQALGLENRVAQDGSPQESLVRAIRKHCPDVLPLAPLIGQAVGIDIASTPESEAISPEFRGAATAAAMVDLITQSVELPAAIVVDDAMHIDDASRRVLNALAREAPERALIVVAMRRPDTLSAFAEDTGAIRLDLDGLPDSDAEVLIDRILSAGGRSAEAHVRKAVVARANGNPLLAIELAQHVRNGASVDDLPETAESLLVEQLDQLPPTDRLVLRYASVVGPRFEKDLVRRMLSASKRSPLDERCWARMSGFIQETGRDGRFLHPLFQEVAYNTLSFSQRRKLHQSVGLLLEVDQSRQTFDLAEHFFRSNDRARAWKYSIAAGREATKRSAAAEAVRAYERAFIAKRWVRNVGADELAAAAKDYADALVDMGDLTSADMWYRKALRANPHDIKHRAGCLSGRGFVQAELGNFASAERALRSAIRAGEQVPGWNRGVVLVPLAVLNARRGDFQAAIALALEAIDAIPADDHQRRGVALMAAAGAAIDSGDLDTHYAQAALEELELAQDFRNQALALNNLGSASYYGGRWTEAASRYRLAAERARAAGDTATAVIAEANLAELLSDQGHYDEVIHSLEACQAAMKQLPNPIISGFVHYTLGRAEARRGRPDRAERSLRTAYNMLRDIGAAPLEIQAELILAEAAYLNGDHEGGVRLLDAVEARAAAGQGLPGADAFAMRLRCWDLQARGDAGAIEAAERALACAIAAGAKYEELLARASLAVLADDPEAEQAVLTRCAEFGIIRLAALHAPPAAADIVRRVEER